MRFSLYLLGTVVCFYGTCVAATGIWTFTGHCCGIFVPFLVGDATACMPVQDRMTGASLNSGRCNDDWHRDRDYGVFVFLSHHGNGR